MSIALNFQRKRKYGEDLAREAAELEKNTATAFDHVASQAQPKGVPVNLKTAAYIAKEEDIVPCAGTFAVTLPAANSKNAGRRVGIIVRSGTITVNVLANQQVQGGATDSLATVGFFEYVSDGVGWWRR